MEENIRAHAIITGLVQGVFYRAETRRSAQEIGILGWVRNRMDGSVEAVFEGPRSKVDRMLKWCEQGPPHASVQNVDARFEPYTGEFSDFSVRY